MGALGSVIVDLSDLLENPGDSHRVSGRLDADGYAVGEKRFELPAGVSYDIAFTNAGDGILVTGIARAEVSGECDRCLGRASFEVSGEIEEYYLFEEPEDPDGYEDGFELIGADRIVDLGDAIADALIMDTPFTVLCRPECRGLCPVCGADLNEGRCGCPDPSETSDDLSANPFAALKDLKFD